MSLHKDAIDEDREVRTFNRGGKTFGVVDAPGRRGLRFRTERCLLEFGLQPIGEVLN